jgi:hypothetical protein
MSYDFLAFLVLANIVVTISLWRTMHRKAARPNKKAAKLLWDSEPITPKHEPPKTAGDDYASLARDVDRRFFSDFKEFADIVNWELADEFTESRWRLQDLPDVDRKIGVAFDNGPALGRSFKLFYNQLDLGRLEISHGYPYTAETPNVNGAIEIHSVRLLGYDAVTELLGCILEHVGSAGSGQYIQYSIAKTLWDSTYRISKYDLNADNDDWGEISFNFSGCAQFYKERRLRWRQIIADNAAKAAAGRQRVVR